MKFESRITSDYNTETKQHKIRMPLANGESVEFQMNELDMLGLLKTFASILYKSKLIEEENNEV